MKEALRRLELSRPCLRPFLGHPTQEGADTIVDSWAQLFNIHILTVSKLFPQSQYQYTRNSNIWWLIINMTLEVHVLGFLHELVLVFERDNILIIHGLA